VSASGDHDELRRLLGGYLLGGLDEADTDRLDAHLRDCDGCREELDQLAPVPELLQRLPDAQRAAGRGAPPPVSLSARPSAENIEGLLRRMRDERSRERRTARVRWLAAAAVVLVAAATVVAYATGVTAVRRLSAAVGATVADGAGMLVTVAGSPAETIVLHSADFANPAAITLAEVVAAINRQAVAFTAEITHNNRLALLTTGDGAGVTIALAAPATGGDARAALGLASATPVAGSQAFRQLTAASETYRLIGWDPTPAFPAMPAAAVRVSTVEFDLVVRRDGAEVERFGPVSMVDTHDSYVEAVVNDPQRGSAYLVATDLDSASGVGLDAPAPGIYPLTGGADGADPADTAFLGDPAARTGLEAFNGVAIQLLACPESTSVGVAAGAIAYCERRGDAMFVGTVPYGFDREGAKAYAAALRGRKVFGALYGPWIQVVNPDPVAAAVQPLVWIPPVGQVAGTYARIADARGVWKAPAGDEARLGDALGVEYDMTDADHTDLVRNGGVNGIRALPGAGIVVDASRTLSTDTRWLFVNVRRLFNFVKSSLRDGLTWVAQEPNDEALRRMVRFNVVTPFLLGLWRQGAFGSDPAEQVFTVKCDAENNAPQDVANGIFTLEVYFYPAKPAEAILIVVGQQDSGATAADS